MAVTISTTGGQASCFLSALCSLLGGVIGAVMAFQVAGPPRPRNAYDFSPDVLALNATAIKELWAYRRAIAGYEIASELLFGFAFLLLIPITYYVRQYITEKSLLKKLMTLCMFGGGFIPFLTLMELAGIQSTAEYYSALDHLDDEQWKSLEISFQLASGRNIWLATLEWLLLAFGFLFIGVLCRRSSYFARSWANYTLFISVWSFIVFVLDAARYVVPRVEEMLAAGVTLLLLAVIFIPAWLLALAFRMRSAGRAYAMAASRESQSVPNRGANIDDEDREEDTL